jgi:hypothetical protein
MHRYEKEITHVADQAVQDDLFGSASVVKNKRMKKKRSKD